MTREQFIKRLESVGFIRSKYEMTFVPSNEYYWSSKDSVIKILIATNKEMFMSHSIVYSFDELDLFLIEKGIVEKPFDAHAYLLECGFEEDGDAYYKPEYCSSTYKIRTGFRFGVGEVQIISSVLSFVYIWGFTGITKKSIDKAIKLIKFLEELENE